MPAAVELFSDEALTNPLHRVQLSELEIGNVAEGEPQKVFACNTGNTVLKEVKVFVEGEGAKYIQMANDDNDHPGIWAAAGDSIIISNDIKSFWPTEVFEFWVRPLFTLEDSEGVYDFEFVIRGKSIGG